MSDRVISRRDLLKTGAASLAISGGVIATSEIAAADHLDTKEELVENGPITLEYDDEIIAEYQPQLVTEGVEPEPLGFHGLHATSEESTLNAVYGFTKYPYQEGISSSDSHLGDHEPIIVFYDDQTGDVERVEYAAYHWFRGSATGDAFQYADDADHRPILRVDQTYHHYYVYTGNAAGDRLGRENLLESIETWLADGLEENLAIDQPWNPWIMTGRESWWRHTRRNWIDAFLKALWFDLGVSGAAETSDLEEANTW